METAARVRSASSRQGGRGRGRGVGGLLLPPGIRFHPTPEEVVVDYVLPKVLDPSFVSLAVGEVNLNACEPRELPGKANMGEKEWHFFVHKNMRYPTGTRANRATREGYWKATGRDKEIFSSAEGELVGMRKTLVFYTGRAPGGVKTNWVMHEFRLDGKYREQAINNPKWVVCKVFNKKGEGEITPPSNAGADYSAETTPNVSSVEVDVDTDADADADVPDFVDSMFDPSYFDNYMSSIPDNTTTATITDPTAAAPHSVNAGYYNNSVPTTAVSFNAMPNYSLTNAASSTQTQVADAMTSSIPTSSYMLNIRAVHDMGRSYNVNQQHLQAIMGETLGGVIGASIYGVPANAPAIAGRPGAVPQQSNVRSYDNGEHAYVNYGVGAAASSAAAMNGQPAAATSARNFDGRHLNY